MVYSKCKGLKPVGYLVCFGDKAMVYWAFLKLWDIACFQEKSRHFRLEIFLQNLQGIYVQYLGWKEEPRDIAERYTTGVTARISCGFDQKYGFWFSLISNKLHNFQGFVIRPGHENLVSMSAVDTIADEGIRY